MAPYPLMPRATALWLVDKTSLTFEQIAVFCGLHILEVQALADGEIESGLAPFDPITNRQLSREEIERCSQDPKASLRLLEINLPSSHKFKGAKYKPLSTRKERPDAIAWMLKHYPQVSDRSLIKLLGTTKTTIEAIRSKTHSKMTQIKPRHPVLLGLCSQKDFDALVQTTSESALDS